MEINDDNIWQILGMEKDHLTIKTGKSDSSQKIWWLNSPSKEQVSQEQIAQQKAFVEWAEQIVEQNNLTTVRQRLDFEEGGDCHQQPG